MEKISRENMPNAYKEVNEILKYVGEEERRSIPESFYRLINAKMNKRYNYYYDETKEFKEHEMLQETRAILGYIYLKYWANEKEKNIIESKLQNDLRHVEEKKREKYNPNEIFKSIKEEKNNNKNGELHQELESLIEVKEFFLSRIVNKIMNKIKNFFKIKKL